MTQRERRIYLIRELMKEQPQYADVRIPAKEQEQRKMLRSLFNIRLPRPASKIFLEVQNLYFDVVS